jgi:hypothetical protein
MAENDLEFSSAGTLFDRYGHKVPVIKINSPWRIPMLMYQCPLNVDWDGSATGYGVDRADTATQKFPLQKGLTPHETGMANAKNKKTHTWAGVYSATEAEARRILTTDKNFNPKISKYPGLSPKDREKAELGDRLALIEQFIDKRFPDSAGAFPVVQIQEDAPARGYYVSQCPAIADRSKKPWDQNYYFDAATIAYGALSDALMSAGGVGLGDYGLIIRNDTGDSLGFFFGDRAGSGSDKVGECSGFVKTTLAPNSDDEDNTFTFLVFPGTGKGTPTFQAPKFVDMVVRFRVQALANSPNSRELAVRMAMEQRYTVKHGDLTPAQAIEFRNIKKAFEAWGWKVDG